MDALDFNDSLGNQEVAEVFTDGLDGDLGNFLYRWEVHDYYDSTTWEFISNDAVTNALQDGSDYGPPDPTAIGMDIKQLAYSATTTVTSPLLTTWSSYNYPHLSEYGTDTGSSSSDWDDYLFDENGTNVAVDGSTDIVYTLRDQLLLQSSAEILGFVGTYDYTTYFVQDDIQTIIDDCTDAYIPGYATDSDVERFLQIPTNYDTTSGGVIGFANDIDTVATANSYTYYERAAYIIDQILFERGTPTADQTDNGGRDRAQLLIEDSDHSISAFLALTIMTMRLNGIPARPVFGFAIGTPNGGDPNNRTLAFANLYGWVEALLPIDEGGADPVHRWGQFQIGPYPSGVDLVYCENTLYTSYDVDVSMYEYPTYNVLPTQTVGSDEVYILDNLQYVVRADVDSEGSPAVGAMVNFKAVTAADYQTYQTNPSQLLAVADDLGNEVTNGIGRAEVYPTFNSTAYPLYNPSDPDSTTYIVFAFISFTSLNATGFIIVPEGYLTTVSMNATTQYLPSPEDPMTFYNYYIVQRGFTYSLSTTLYAEPGLITPLTGRNVSYYVLTADELQQLQLGLIGPEDVTKIGDGLTNGGGTSTVYSNDGVTDYFALPEDTTYFLVANYGQNYTFSIMLLIDFLRSETTLNDTVLDVGVDGFFLWENFDFYLFMQPPLGAPTVLDGEAVEVWFIQESDYQVYTGVKDVATYKSELTTTLNASIPYNKILYNGVTDASGFINTTIVVDARNHGAGTFVFLTFYLDRWNASVSVFISTPPASFVVAMNQIYSEPIHGSISFSVVSMTNIEYMLSLSIILLPIAFITIQTGNQNFVTIKESYYL
ncbi:MAG: hypothetical protein ACTSQC_01015 [Candidatus Heimdallarchaeaceae archaeon]